MIKWLTIAGTALVLDQLSKSYIVANFAHGERLNVLPFFSWARFHNEGAAFSFLASAGPWKHWFFVLLGIGFSIYLIYELRRLKPEEQPLGWVFSLILGGALGNVTDRLLHGHVIDFVYFHYQGYSFPAFNVADSSLFCGAVLWIFLMIQDARRSKELSSHE
ncbi:MAG: signal peptidase II [Limisphaerales bacterium]|jgi:signal peptidase II